MKKKTAAAWGVYLLTCADGTLYCGVTNNIEKRLAAHNSGKGARYTRGRKPVELAVFSGGTFTYAEALRLERRIKRLPKEEKLSGFSHLAKLLAQPPASRPRRGRSKP